MKMKIGEYDYSEKEISAMRKALGSAIYLDGTNEEIARYLGYGDLYKMILL